MNEALFSIDSQSSIRFSSTFTPGSFQLTNNSDSQNITSITLDLSSAIFPDLVFDPTGSAGDATAKGFEFDSQNEAGNTITVADYPFNDPVTPFSGVRNGGYDVLTLNFTGFEPGQTLKFSADVDPTSIQGADDPGPSDSGSISGLELVGATITVKFADDTELTGQVYRTPNSEVASEVTLAAAPQAAPAIAAIGFDGTATVNDANQTIRVTGNAGAEVSLLVVEGGFYTGGEGGGVDPDPDAFEANRAIAVNELTATIGDAGFVDIPVNLTYTEVDGSGGLNYIVAKYQGNSLVSDRVVLEYDPNSIISPNPNPNPNPGTGTLLPDGTIRVEAEEYNANIDGQQYFDFEPENRGGAYRINEPVDIEATSDVGGGFNVAFIQSGEFLTYDVNVAEAGTYDVVLRVASPSEAAQSAEVSIGGQSYPVSFNPTGDWQVYQDVLVSNVSLAAGTQQLRFDAKSSEFNLNYIDLTPAEPGVDSVAPTAVLNTTSVATVVGTANTPTFSVTYSDDTAINIGTTDNNDLTVTAPDGTAMAVTLISVDPLDNGSPLTATYAIAAPGGAWDLAEAGDYTIALKAEEIGDTAGNTAVAANLGSLNIYFADPNDPPTATPPASATVLANGTIRIEAEDYQVNVDGGQYFDFDVENRSGAYRPNEPVDIEATNDVGGGFNVAFIQSGEFLTYNNFEVAEAGNYNIVLRVASPATSTQSAEVSIGGQSYPIDFEPTGDWQTYQDVLVTNVNLAAGTQQLRFDAKSSEFNLNYIELTPAEPGVDSVVPTAVLNTTTASQVADSTNAVNFTVTYSDNLALDATTIDANDLTVTAPDGTVMAVSLVSVEAGTATYAIAAPEGAWELAEAGEYTITLNADEISDTAGNFAAAGVLGTLNLAVTETAPNGTIRIEAEDYKAGTNGTEYFDFDADINQGGAYRLEEGVDVEVTGDVDGNFNVGYIQSGEFLTYDLNIPTAGEYDIVLRVAANEDAQSLEVVSGEETYTANFDFTGSFQTYIDVTIPKVALAAGEQELRLNAKSSAFNLNYFELIPSQPVDATAPTAVLNTTTATQTVDDTAAVNFTVTYSDDTALDATTIDANDLTVTAPDGTAMAVSLVNFEAGVATYAIAAPEGSWDLTEAGDYSVSLNADEVSDAAGNSAIASVLGTLNLTVEPIVVVDTTAPTAILNTTTATQTVDDTAAVNFTVTYSDDTALDATTIDANDLTVTAPDGTAMAVSLVNFEAGVATYAIAAPEGSWDLTEAGDYTISLNADEVMDAAGNATVASELGTLNLTVNEVAIDDTTPPTAVLNTTTATQTVDDSTAVNFTVTYSDDTALDATTIDANDLTVTAPDGTAMAVSLVSFEAGVATYAIAASEGSWDLTEAGDYTISLQADEVSDAAGNAAVVSELGTLNLTVNENTSDRPPVPTIRIEAEDYKQGMNGVAYLDTSSGNFGGKYRYDHVDIEATNDGDGGFNVSSIQAGEFLTYDVDVSQAGNYDVVLRVATPADGQSLDLTLGGQTVTANFDATSGAQTYQDVVVSNVSLDAGSQELRLDMKSSNFSLNYIELVHNEPDVVAGDTTAPTAVLNTTTATQTVDDTAAVNFTVTYSDDTALDAATIDANDLTVTAPDGTAMAASLVSFEAGVATYAIAAPEGSWDLTEAGEYSISLKADEVSDAAGNSAAASVLGTLDLTVNPVVVVDTTAPTAVLNTTTATQTVDDTAAVNFTVTYSDDTALDATTIDANDLTVTAPDGTAMAVSLVSFEAGVATYAIAAPEGSWDLTEAGEYSISLKADEVSDAAGNFAAASDLGTLDLTVNPIVVVDITAPTAVLDTTTASQTVDDTTAVNFTVTYSDDTVLDATTIDANDLTVTAPDGTVMAVSLVSVDAGVATYAIAAPSGTWAATDAGIYNIAVNPGEVTDSSGNELAAGVLGTLTVDIAGEPSGNTIRIEAEDYKAGTNGTEYFDFDNDINRGGAYRLDEGVDVEVTGDVDGDFNVGYIQSGEFLTYDVDVAEAGEYNIKLRVAANEDAQSLEVVAGEETYTANFDFTGSFQTYIDVIIPNVNLAAGAQELRLNATSSAFNINYFELIPAGDFVDDILPTAALAVSDLIKQPDSNEPANFTVNFSDNIGIDAASIDSNDVTVTTPDGTVLTTTLTGINNDSNGNPQSATYFFDAPGGTWDAADTGSYAVNLNGEEVADPSGNFAAAAALGSFTIDVTEPIADGTIRINAGAIADAVDSNNKLWLADANFVGGLAATVGDAIDFTTDDFIYQSQRAGGNFNYSIPVEDGNYKVNLHLAELDFGDAGFREFDVALEGDLVLDNYDIWANTKNAQRDGGDTAKIQEISDLSIIRDGAIDLDFTAVANNATIAGIEILPIEGAQVLILESGEGTLVTEGGNSDTYQVLLNTQPTADVAINLQPDAQASVDQNTLIFTPENWSVPQTVTVSAVDDDASENFSVPATISHTISTTDASYSSVNIPNLNLQVIDNEVADAEVKFEQKVLDINLSEKTTAAWGPDGRLYVGSRGGTIEAYTLDDNYNITDTQVISTLQNLPNHEILGIAFNPFENDGGEPKLYVSHSELYANEYTYEREGGTGFNELVDFSPYSGEVSVLSGADFSQRETVVDNLGVSNHDHGINGLAFDGNGDLLIAVGSNTNAGIPDDDIGGLDESPFTAAIIKAEITKPNFNGNIQYQLPADWVAPEGLQVDPLTSQGFGGIVDVVPGTDVSVYASGLRNSYDLVYSTKGILYATENDANSGFGDYSTSATTQEPFNLDPANEINIVEEGNYYGNPNRNRGRQDDRQNVYYPSYDSSNDEYTAPIRQHGQHIHGITEYRSTTFSEQLRGDLLTIELDSNGGTVINVELTDDGRGVENLVGLKTEASGGESLTQGLDVVTGFGGSIIGINYFGNVTAAIPVTNTTTATAYEIDEWRAPASGGGSFTIGGVNFSELGDTTVTIGNETASLVSVSDRRIFGTLPAFSATEYANEGLLDITVTSGGESSIITDAFQPLFIQKLAYLAS